MFVVGGPVDHRRQAHRVRILKIIMHKVPEDGMTMQASPQQIFANKSIAYGLLCLEGNWYSPRIMENA